ncbi:GIY-YIG nuclease family protein [Chryseobacterium sp. PS-8]|uniref:GIY-YIG nuclease family protein n=1 Tax=Chryseobacterium indicum TaxID=2766954 RepID=A0ABS9C947_9FLAO|nr:GIY-YIG nuclease family protein [Chryseobacterium sp. PS-8]MCF2221102.1 GIY-YIG nuclease family protein [Chryseobacterium sp. PS-8]
MTGSAFSLGEELELRKVEYKLHRDLWNKFNFPNLDLAFGNWTKIKYLNATADALETDVENIPDDKGGLYMFYVKCEVISGITEYPLYIGRAQKTQTQNLKKRVKEYFQHFSKDNERPKITRMFKYWANDLHLAYITVDENDEIKDLEKHLINSLLLPMNTEIPDTEIKQAIKAFQ